MYLTGWKIYFHGLLSCRSKTCLYYIKHALRVLQIRLNQLEYALYLLLWQPACQSRHAAFFEQGGPGRCTAHPDFSHRRNPDFYGSARESTAFFSGSRFSLFPSKQVPQIMPVDHCFIAAELIPKLRIFLLQFVDVQLSPDRFILCQL